MANGNFAGGTGTVDNPFLIEDAFDLNAVRNKLTANYKMIKNIDLNIAPFNTGSGWIPIGIDINNAFKGIFDGNGKQITGLFIKRQEEGQALFKAISGGTLKNICLTNINIELCGHNGATLIGVSNGGNILNCCSCNGIVRGYTYSSAVGGLVGSNGGTIKNCYSNVQVLGGYNVGGISGGNSTYSKVINSYSSGTSKIGLMGSSSNPSGVINSYWDMETSNQTISTGGIGKTTLEMKTPSTFIDWDKEKLENGKGVWILQDGQYPKLWFEKPPAKHLLKQNNQYYSIKSELYNDSKFQPITEFQVKPALSKADYDNFGIEDLNILTQNMTVGTETFRPIDKFTGEIEIYKYTEK